jgi:hypothetical protein
VLVKLVALGFGVNEAGSINFGPDVLAAMSILLTKTKLKLPPILSLHIYEILVLLAVIVGVFATFGIFKKWVDVFFAAANVAKR